MSWTKDCGVISNRVLLSTYDGQPRLCAVLPVSGASLLVFKYIQRYLAPPLSSQNVSSFSLSLWCFFPNLHSMQGSFPEGSARSEGPESSLCLAATSTIRLIYSMTNVERPQGTWWSLWPTLLPSDQVSGLFHQKSRMIVHPKDARPSQGRSHITQLITRDLWSSASPHTCI